MKLTRALTVTVAVSMLAVPAIAAPRETATPGLSPSMQYAITPVRGGTVAGIPGFAKPGSVGGTNNGISYRGGAVMTDLAGVNAYVIWYGDWGTSASPTVARTIVTDFLTNIGGSPYYNINSTYYDGSGNKVVNKVTLAGQAEDPYISFGRGVTLADADIDTIVSNALTAGLRSDQNGVYFVLTSKDVAKSGFLTSYCGWHTYGTKNGQTLKWSFVGNPGTNGACAAQTTSSPNGDIGADAMVSVIAHELEEAATDPQLNAWYDNRGYENADKCAWKFGTTSTATNGSKYNLTLKNNQKYLVQQNWLNANGGLCAMGY